MKIKERRRWGTALLLLWVAVPVSSAFGQAQHVRWDIINFEFVTPPALNTATAGGVSDAKAPDGTRLRFTGTGTFVAPPGHHGGGVAVKGGGTWQLFNAAGGLVASGTYAVTEVVLFAFANFQTPGAINDLIGPGGANGNAALRIVYSDGDTGILLVACHGPGAPAGISEGVAATKGYKTFDQIQPPAPGVNANRTSFHVR
ncbi:MAG: hypothetical protein DMG13_06905 [Acidobacteria bacterium]|nr:MAG: hypothetical protein DMG13_06905 [Acidobacteriota bacterium]